MADRDKETDIDKLLAEVESTLGGRSPGAPAHRAERQPEGRGGGLVARVRTAAVSGAAAAAIVWVVFAVLPFLRAPSGAIGAFLAAFVAVLALRRR